MFSNQQEREPMKGIAYNPEKQTILKGSWCEHDNILECMNNKYSDVTAFETFQNYPFPTNAGMYGMVSRVHRLDENDYKFSFSLPAEKFLTDHGDLLIQYTGKRGKPTSEQMLTALLMLSEEVLEIPPSDNPINYLFMQKVIESTLYISALEDRRGIYSKVERFRNCIQFSIMKGNMETLQNHCRIELITPVENLATSIIEK